MTITLPKELEASFKQRMENGPYQTPEEMIRAGLCLLEAQEKGMAALRSELMRGVADIEEGRFITCATDEELSDLGETTIAGFKRENDSVVSR
jgi:putative addiction module CopG family antidote